MKSIIVASFLSMVITFGGYIGIVKFTNHRPAAKEESVQPLTRDDLAAAELQLKGFNEQKDAMIAVRAAYDATRANVAIARDILVDEQQKIDELHGQIEEEQVSAGSQSDESISKVAKLYESMKPEQAAQIASELSTDLLVEIIPRMKDRSAGKLLSAMESSRAAEISRRLAEQEPRKPAKAN